ncbi:TonB-dependent receptor domain-containing protein [Sphingomonas sp. GCM10030256]|uniref:TonB-dependent receptor domain-containing protein n=1 Tax=Sphingomonas sp. GCM10030256 TaxID=3273427 RepID=UPI0036070F4B
MMKRFQVSLRATSATVALALAFTTSPAAAQSTQPPPDVADAQASPSAASEPEEIVVTGSRIRRNPLEQDAPIVFVDEADIAKTGLNSVNDVLQRLPSSGGGLNGKFNNSGNVGNPPDGGGVGAGSAEIDLRYLGTRRTLVLVDGLRFVNGASASGVPGSVDLNSIPESMIERVEVLQDGASAIYGSDAIAGVVNIITKRSQQGIEGSAQLGGFTAGDGFSQNYQLSWGNGDGGPLSIVVGGNYVKQGAVRSGDRALSRFPVPYADACDPGCSSFTPDGRFAIPGFFGTSQTLISSPTATPTVGNFRNFVSPNDRFNFAPFNYFQIPLDRYGAFANLKYEVADDIDLILKGLWNKRKSKNQAAPLPFGLGPDAGLTPVLDATTVDATNPFNPFDVTLDFTNTSFILRRFVEGGPRRFSQSVKSAYASATLDGKFTMLDQNWYWDINGAYGRNKARQTFQGNINSNHLRQALGPEADCVGQPGDFGGTCVPFNLFGGAGSITPAMLDFVTFVQRDSSKQSLWDFTANLSGGLLDLPGGQLGLAAGVEYRRLSGRFDPDPIVAAGFSSDIPAGPTKGRISVKEAYAELNAPLLRDAPFANLLELNGAVRISDYSTSGSTTTFKGGVNWKPFRDLRLRGSFAEGFRAPSIGELFGTLSRFDQTISDPCSNDSTAPRTFLNDATVRANCIAAGVPANGSYAQANSQISVIVSGNEELEAESSKSWIFGGVYSPSFLPGLAIEANHYKIKIDRAIQAVDAAITLNNCVVADDPAACALVTRSFSGSGQLTQIDGTLGNIAGIKTKGIDFNLSYRNRKTAVGTFGLTWNNTFLRNFDLILTGFSGTQVISREGTEVGSPSQGFPKWKSVGILDWDLATFGGTVTGRYVSKLRESDGNVMKRRFYTDLQLRWRPTVLEDEFGFALGVNNLFKTKAPGCNTCDLNNFDPTVYDIPGRYFYARATVEM